MARASVTDACYVWNAQLITCTPTSHVFLTLSFLTVVSIAEPHHPTRTRACLRSTPPFGAVEMDQQFGTALLDLLEEQSVVSPHTASDKTDCATPAQGTASSDVFATPLATSAMAPAIAAGTRQVTSESSQTEKDCCRKLGFAAHACTAVALTFPTLLLASRLSI